MLFSDFFTASNITFFIGIIGIIFTIWGKITKPQQKSELVNALQNQRETIFSALYEKRFTEIQDQFKNVMTLNQNHVHTLDTKIEQTITSQNNTNIQIAKLETTIGLLVKLFPVANNNNNIIQQ